MVDDDPSVSPAVSDLFVGVDLAWSTGTTGLAAVDGDGALVALGKAVTDTEIDTWLLEIPTPLVVAVDAPLVVPNETGQRRPEKEIGRAFGAFGASAHATNRQLLGAGVPRALALAHRHGWTVDLDAPLSGRTQCLEVYPHPALVGLFTLPYRLDYKKGSADRRRPGLLQLMRLLESLPELRAGRVARWREIADVVASSGTGRLNGVEDELDAVVCAHLAWLWAHDRARLDVYGDLSEGYIVATPPPSHPAVRPLPRTSAPTPAGSRIECFVAGRPTGYGGSENERRWKKAVQDAFAQQHLPGPDRVEVVAEFVLAPEQAGRWEPDLDNLLKSTIDALDEVLGRRSGTGERVEADDVRVTRIVASKRAAAGDDTSGARVVLTALEAPPA